MVGKKHVYETRIRERHLDNFGHVNNAKYFELFEEARWELISTNGFGLHDVLRSGRATVILDTTVKFRRELALRSEIRIESYVSSISRRLGNFHQTILNEKGEMCAEADFRFALFDLVNRKILTWTDDWLKAVGVEGSVPRFGQVSTSSTETEA